MLGPGSWPGVWGGRKVARAAELAGAVQSMQLPLFPAEASFPPREVAGAGGEAAAGTRGAEQHPGGHQTLCALAETGPRGHRQKCSAGSPRWGLAPC